MDNKTYLFQADRKTLYALNNPENIDESTLFCFETEHSKSGGIFHNISVLEDWSSHVPKSVKKGGIEKSLQYIHSGADIILFSRIGLLGSLLQKGIFTTGKYYEDAYQIGMKDNKEMSLPPERVGIVIIDGINDIMKKYPNVRHIQFSEGKAGQTPVAQWIKDNRTPIRVRDRIFLSSTQKIIDKASDELRASFVNSIIDGEDVFYWHHDIDVPYGIVGTHSDTIPEFSIRTDYCVSLKNIELRLPYGATKKQSLYNLHISGPVNSAERLSTLPDLRSIAPGCNMETLILENTMISAQTIESTGVKPDIIEVIEDEVNAQAYLLSTAKKPLSDQVGFQGYRYSWESFIDIMNGDSDPIGQDDILGFGDVDEGEYDDEIFLDGEE